MIRGVDRLRHFLAVARAGNVNAAARELGLSQPALTKNIRKLEEEFGVELFTRHARGMTLTQFGEMLLRHAKLVEAELRFAEAEIKSLQGGQVGHLRVGAGPFWGVTLVPRAIARLQVAFPQLRIDLEIGVNPVIHPRLFRGDLDIVFSAEPETDELPPFIAFEELLRVPNRVCASRSHPLVRVRRAKPADLSHYPWVEYQDDLDNSRSLLAMLRAHRCPPPRYLVRASSLLAIINLLRSGPYLACLAEPILSAWPDLGVVTLPGMREVRSYLTGTLYHRSLREMTPVRTLISYLAEDAAKLKAARMGPQRYPGTRASRSAGVGSIP
jgi:DNA-binding transcriptional LysR family regulator